MAKKILVTGGAGFIGSHTVDALIQRGHSVRILDNLDQEVHGRERKAPSWLNPDAEFLAGDIRNLSVLKKALKDIEIVYHFASKTAVGQSMREASEYVDVNINGSALLCDLISKGKNR